jgi:hypothetical protein
LHTNALLKVTHSTTPLWYFSMAQLLVYIGMLSVLVSPLTLRKVHLAHILGLGISYYR